MVREATSLSTLPAGLVTTAWYSPAEASVRLARVRVASVPPSTSSPACFHWYVIGSVPVTETSRTTLPPTMPLALAGCVPMVTGWITRTGMSSLVTAPAKLLTSTV